MKTSRQVTSTLFVLFVIVQATLVKSQKTYQCNGHEITMSAKEVEGLKKCGEEIGVKSMEEMTAEKLPCFAKCILGNSGLVDGEGKPHKENILSSIDASVPKEMGEAYKNAVEKCIDEHGQHINPKDTNCQTYAPLAMCVTAAFKGICHG